MLRTSKLYISRYQTPSLSPPKGKPPSPLFPSPTLIPPFMGNPLFPPRSPPLTGKGDVPPFVLSPPTLIGRTQKPLLTPQPPLIRRLTPLLSSTYFSSSTSSSSLSDTAPNSHSPLRELPTLSLLLFPQPLISNTHQVPLYSLTVMVSYTVSKNHHPFSFKKKILITCIQWLHSRAPSS